MKRSYDRKMEGFIGVFREKKEFILTFWGKCREFSPFTKNLFCEEKFFPKKYFHCFVWENL